MSRPTPLNVSQPERKRSMQSKGKIRTPRNIVASRLFIDNNQIIETAQRGVAHAR
jgi:hypothetical protein